MMRLVAHPDGVDVVAPFQKQSAVFPPPSSIASARFCTHKKSLVAAGVDRAPAFIGKISHLHNPVLQTKRGNAFKGHS